jgi:gliding motility-associated-like protein
MVARAELSSDFTVSVSSEASECYANGKILVKFDGAGLGQLQATDRINFYTHRNGSSNIYRQHDFSMSEMDADGNFILEGYPQGNYSVDYSIVSGTQEVFGNAGTTTVSGGYLAPYAAQSLGNNNTMSGTRHTLNCKPTGRIQLEIMQGKMPYFVQVYKNGTLLRVNTFSSRQHSGDDPYAEDYRDYYNIEDLDKGSYTFEVLDDCGSKITLTEHAIDISDMELSCDPNFVAHSVPAGSNEINFVIKKEFFKDIKYDSNPEQWLELRYRFEDDPNWQPWQTFTDSLTHTMLDIKQAYNKRFYFEVRVKDCPSSYTPCRAEILIPEPHIPPDPPCSPFRGIAAVLKGIPITEGGDCACSEQKSYVIYSNYEVRLSYRLCSPDPSKMPISYTLRDINTSTVLINNKLFSGNAVNDVYSDLTQPIPYGKTLHARLAYSDGSTYYDTIIVVPQPSPPTITPAKPIDWKVYSTASEIGCESNPSGIFDLMLNCNEIPAGTVIELIEAPKGYYFKATHTGNLNFQIDQNTNDFEILPISQTGLCELSFTMFFKELSGFGAYAWRITDGLGNNFILRDTLVDNYRRFEIRKPLSLISKNTCNGTIYYPQAEVISYNPNKPASITLEDSKFRIIKGNPTGYEINGGKSSVGLCNRDSMMITKPGQYIIESFANPFGDEPDSGIDSCTVRYDTINYTTQPVAFDDYYGFLCANSTNSDVTGNISVFAQEGSGVQPYRFDLYSGSITNPGKLIDSNYTGEFPDIVSGSARFYVFVEDACKTSFQIDIPLTPVITNDVIFGDLNICQGTEANLWGKMIGSQQQVQYLWTGTNDFSYIDPPRNRQILSEKLMDPATYYLEITGLGCRILDSLTVIPSDTIHIYYADTICTGTAYDGGMEFLNPLPQTASLPAGLHHFTANPEIAINGGCDSITHLALHIVDEDGAIEEKYEICENKFPYYWINGDTIFEEGSLTGAYDVPKTTKSGCPYFLRLNLKVNPIFNDTLPEKIICSYENEDFNGESYNTTGFHTAHLYSQCGCDSLSTLALSVVAPARTERYDTIIAIYNNGYHEYPFDIDKQEEAGEIRDDKVLIKLDSITTAGYGCDSLVALYLTILAPAPMIPEGFSPNGDGVNDRLVINILGSQLPFYEFYPNNHLMIFNRWGNLLYEGKPYMNDWDGRNYEGGNPGSDDLPPGTYFYILELGDGSKAKKGFIFLNR